VKELRVNIESPVKDGDAVSFALGEDYPELRDAVRRICAKYPGEYWRGLDERSEYPTAFVNDLTAGGYLAALIPPEYGGAGLPIRAAAAILEEINLAAARRRSATRRCTSWARCCGTAARAEAALPARHRAAASCGCRRSASPSRPPAPTPPS
jgi:alkylation response protein AidB-like acyl-CoA dehydrogenase